MYPARCAACEQSAVLIGIDADGHRICGPCAGWKLDYRCESCGQPGVRTNGRCSQCITAELVDKTLCDADGHTPAQLQPLADALLSARDPRSVAVWLGRSEAAGLLTDLACTGETITHEALDRLPPGRHVNYVREILVRTAILPWRNEHLERIEPWLERQMVEHSAEHARLVRSYAVWYLRHRARRAKRPLGDAGAARIRDRVRIALEFLTWIENNGRTLQTIDQGDVDKWLANGTWRHREIRPFLHWTHQRRLTTGLSAPAKSPGQPSVFIDEAAHLDQLNRCLNDNSIDTDLRAAGALILLYGINTTRVLALRRNQLHKRRGNTYLMLGDHELVLPPNLAELLAQLPRSTRRSTLPEPHDPDGLLFPGRSPNRAVHSGSFGQRLRRNGLTIRGGRNTALIALAAALPAAVLADLLAIDVTTATRWAGYAKRDWHDYLAARRVDAGHQPPTRVAMT